MNLSSTFNGDWRNYWEGFSNVAQLKKWSADMDQLLRNLEKKMNVKLLARDHFEIIEALEKRIEELERVQSASRSDKLGVQGELFTA